MAGFAVLAGPAVHALDPGLRADLDSPTADIMEPAGSSFTAKREAVEQLFFHWIEASPDLLPPAGHDARHGRGGVGLVAAAWRLAGGRLNPPPGRKGARVWLAVAMVASVFTRTLVLLALGTDIFGARNLAPAWVGMPFSSVRSSSPAGPWGGFGSLILMIAGFMVSTIRLMDPNRSTINYSRSPTSSATRVRRSSTPRSPARAADLARRLSGNRPAGLQDDRDRGPPDTSSSSSPPTTPRRSSTVPSAARVRCGDRR